MPYRLIYSSKATEKMAVSDVESLLAEARTNNQAPGITGVLVFVDGVFLQILEGEKSRIVELMDKIARDPRHRNTKTIHTEENCESAFESWSMAYLSPDPEEVSRWANLDGGGTIEDVVSSIQAEPDRLPQFAVNILKSLAL